MDDKLKKRTVTVEGPSSARKTPVHAPVTPSRMKPSSSAKRQVQPGPSGSTASIKFRKNMLPVGRVNPADIKLKVPQSARSQISETNRPMVVDASISRTLRHMPEPTLQDQDEEVLDMLYTRYLQKSLLAQAQADKRRMTLERNAQKLIDICLEHVAWQLKTLPVLSSVNQILTEAELIEKLESLEKVLLPFIQKLCEESTGATFEQLQNQLAKVLDVLTVRNGTVPPQLSNSKILSAVNEQVQEACGNPRSSLNFAQGITETRQDLHAISNEATVEEKEVNEDLIKLLSLVLGQLALRRQSTGASG